MVAMTDKKAVLVGYGYAGRILGAYALTNAEGVRLDAVIDVEQSVRENAKLELGDTRTFASVEEFLDNGEHSDSDIVWIANHAPDHRDTALAFINAGCKSIICEKPLTTSLMSARIMVDRVRREGATFTVHEEHRFRAPFLVSKQAILDGSIGDIMAVEMWGKGRRPPYELIEMMGHMTQQSLEVLEGLGGVLTYADATILEPAGRLATLRDVYGLNAGRPCGRGVGKLINTNYYFTGVRNSGEVVVNMRLEEVPGAQQGDQRPGLLFYGTKGKILVREYDAWITRHTRYDLMSVAPNARPWECLAGDIDTPYVMEEAQESSVALLSDFLAAIEEGRDPAISAEHAYKSFEMLRASYYAHFNGGRISFPLIPEEEPFYEQ